MKIKIISNPITQMGSFSRDDILTTDKYTEAFLKHLVYDCGAAILLEDVDYEIKVDLETVTSAIKAATEAVDNVKKEALSIKSTVTKVTKKKKQNKKKRS